MEARRMRRFGRDRPRSEARSFLPLQTTTTSNTANLSHTISCWFCDYKIRALNEPLFRFGRRHARSLRVWFSVGVGFSLAALLAVTIILLWELGKALHLFHQRTELGYISTASLFGFSPFKVSGLRMSLADAAYFFISTLISVSVHELGHALAAAWYKEVKKGTFSMESSEGIHMEYIAIFIAVLFPGALVAFEYELLQALPQFTALRVYCAGIWHNAVCCAGCGLMLFLLPWILSPFYIHSESPMVLDVSSTSPLSKYLSPGDLIMSLDGVHIHNAEEWMEMAALIEEGTHRTTDNAKYVEGFGTVNSRKGYCVPSFMIEDGLTIQSVDNGSACPNDLTAFVNIPCLDTRMLNGGKTMDGHPSGRRSTHCMNDKDIVKLNKCGDGWARIAFGTSCTCSVDEACLSPLQMPGMNWVEITYLGSLSLECMQLGRNAFSATKTSDFLKSKCVGTFVFVGDVISMAHSVCLTAYHARWGFRFGAYLPVVLERLLVCTFGVSLTLALLNTLPVYFLDGESLLEVILCHFTLLSPSRREKVLQLCLLGGTLISILTFVRIFFSLFNL